MTKKTPPQKKTKKKKKKEKKNLHPAHLNVLAELLADIRRLERFVDASNVDDRSRTTGGAAILVQRWRPLGFASVLFLVVIKLAITISLAIEASERRRESR